MAASAVTSTATPKVIAPCSGRPARIAVAIATKVPEISASGAALTRLPAPPGLAAGSRESGSVDPAPEDVTNERGTQAVAAAHAAEQRPGEQDAEGDGECAVSPDPRVAHDLELAVAVDVRAETVGGISEAVFVQGTGEEDGGGEGTDRGWPGR